MSKQKQIRISASQTTKLILWLDSNKDLFERGINIGDLVERCQKELGFTTSVVTMKQKCTDLGIKVKGGSDTIASLKAKIDQLTLRVEKLEKAIQESVCSQNVERI